MFRTFSIFTLSTPLDPYLLEVTPRRSYSIMRDFYLLFSLLLIRFVQSPIHPLIIHCTLTPSLPSYSHSLLVSLCSSSVLPCPPIQSNSSSLSPFLSHSPPSPFVSHYPFPITAALLPSLFHSHQYLTGRIKRRNNGLTDWFAGFVNERRENTASLHLSSFAFAFQISTKPQTINYQSASSGERNDR